MFFWNDFQRNVELLLSILLLVSIVSTSAQGATWSELRDGARAIEQRFPFEVRISNVAPLRTKAISYQSIGSGEYPAAAAHLQLLSDELGKYPRSFLRATGLKWIALVKNLTVSGGPRAATYDYLERALLFDVRQVSYDKLHRRHLLHHEFFHLIDEIVTGFRTDEAWLALNPKGFTYWQNRGIRDSRTVMLDHPQTGFVTTYAISSIHEDRAEIHAALFVGEHYRDLVRIMQKDSVVRRKVSYIVQMLHRIDPAINEAYFQRLHELRTPALSK